MAYWLGCWITNSKVLNSKPLGDSKLGPTIHPFDFDQMSTKNYYWGRNG